MALKVGVVQQEPRAFPCAVPIESKCAKRGFGVEYTQFVCRALKKNCTFLWYKEGKGDYGDVSANGTITGIMLEIHTGNYDLSLPVTMITESRYNFMDYSELYDINDIYLMTRAPDLVNEGVSWNIVTGFELQVWLSFAFVVLFTALVIKLILKSPGKSANDATSIVELCRALVMNEFEETNLRFTTIRIIATAWLVSGFVLSSAYNGMLYADKVVLRYDLPFTDIHTFLECLDTKRCDVITANYTTITQERVTNWDNKSNERGGNRLKKNWIIVSKNEDVPPTILAEQNRYLVFVMPQNVMAEGLLNNHDCKFYTVMVPYVNLYAFVFAKKSPLKKEIDKIMFSSRETGLIDYLNKKYYMTPSTCKEDWSKPRATVIEPDNGDLKMLLAMSPIFWFYVLGVFVELIAFALEATANRFASRIGNAFTFPHCPHF